VFHFFKPRNFYSRYARFACLVVTFLVTGNRLSSAIEPPCDCDDQNPSQLLLVSNESAPKPTGQQTAPHSAAHPQAVLGPTYLNPNASIEERVNDLFPGLTLAEKVEELRDSWGSPAIPRLKIPVMLKAEGLDSQSHSLEATVFPHGIAMASTFNTVLINQVGKATAVEARAANLRASWSPVLDVARDARWGRVEETYGEDPYLVSRMGVGWITGFQSENMIAIPKHFAGRDSHDVGLSDRVMREVHLVPFRVAVEEAHAGGIMAAYSTWDATPDNASVELLQKILREEWEFEGVVVSDCGGVENLLTKQSVVTNMEEACRLAVLAGVDT
jgi:beta-glucosidase